MAIYKISESKGYTTNIDLERLLGLSNSTVFKFLNGNRRNRLMEKYINKELEVPNPTKYTLNDRGKNLVSLIIYFENFYSNFKT